MTKRFGADQMVVPAGTSEKVQSILLRGAISYFYFDAAVVDSAAQTGGVACASPQFFLTSLAEGYCDVMVQLIACDPATDFVVQPWMAEKYHKTVEDGQVVVGSRITIRADNTIRLLGHQYPVAARLNISLSAAKSRSSRLRQKTSDLARELLAA
jgi:putative ABC transport system permease protein